MWLVPTADTTSHSSPIYFETSNISPISFGLQLAVFSLCQKLGLSNTLLPGRT